MWPTQIQPTVPKRLLGPDQVSSMPLVMPCVLAPPQLLHRWLEIRKVFDKQIKFERWCWWFLLLVPGQETFSRVFISTEDLLVLTDSVDKYDSQGLCVAWVSSSIHRPKVMAPLPTLLFLNQDALSLFFFSI